MSTPASPYERLRYICMNWCTGWLAIVDNRVNHQMNHKEQADDLFEFAPNATQPGPASNVDHHLFAFSSVRGGMKRR